MSIKNLHSNWQCLELIGKILILVSICFQLIIIGNATDKSAEIDRIDGQNSYNLDSSDYKYLTHLVEDQGLETQLRILQNKRLLVQNQRLININYGGDKQALSEYDKSLRGLTDDIVSSRESIEKQRSKVREAFRQTISVSESSKEIRQDLINISSKNVTDLKFYNYLFLILFMLGSIITLRARHLEIIREKHPAIPTDQNQLQLWTKTNKLITSIGVFKI